jgi:hypothetical protein
MPYDVEEAYIEIRTMLVCIYIKWIDNASSLIVWMES